MTSFLARLLPIVILFGMGMLLRRARTFSESDARMLLKLVIYVALPAYSALSVWRMPLNAEVLLLPVLAVIIVLISSTIGWLASIPLRLPRKTQGVFVLGTSILNLAFAIPFVSAGYGDEGYALLAVFNFGNFFMVFGFSYMLAIRFGSEGGLGWRMLWRVLALPPVWGLMVGLVLNLLHSPVPTIVDETLGYAADLTTPLIMLGLGILFRPRLERVGPLLLALFIRSGVGLLIGLGVAHIFGLTGVIRAIVVLGAAAPTGFNTLVFSTLEDLDSRFAANLVSVALLMGLIYMPLLVMLLGA